MKHLKFTIIPALLALTLTSATFAKECGPVKPTHCPLVQDIISAGFATVQLQNGRYAALQFGNYNTNEAWGFGITGINANSPADALSQAVAALSTLKQVKKPVCGKNINAWSCEYPITTPGLHAIALTTGFGMMPNVSSIK